MLHLMEKLFAVFRYFRNPVACLNFRVWQSEKQVGIFFSDSLNIQFTNHFEKSEKGIIHHHITFSAHNREIN